MIFLRRHAPALIPAAFTIAIPIALWFWARYFYVAPNSWESVRPLAIAGILAMMFLVATVSVILWIATAQPSPLRRGYDFLGYAFVADCCGVLMLLLALLAHAFSIVTALRLYLLLVAWLGVCAAIAWALRRCGPAIAMVATLTLASLVISTPVIAVPLARNAATWGSGGVWQSRILESIACSNPLLAMIEALRPDIRIEWAQLPQMYHLSGMGQDMPMTLVPWWVNTLIYAGIAVAFWVGGSGVSSAISRRARPPSASAQA